MRAKIHLILTAGLLISALAFAQERGQSILPTQVSAIKTLAAKQGFTEAALNAYLQREWNAPLQRLSREDGAELIRLFQSDNPPSMYITGTGKKTLPVVTPQQTEGIVKPEPQRTTENVGSESQEQELILVEILEVGMSKRFHLVDGNIIQGTIKSIENDLCHIETIDGLLKIPTSSILEETAHITKKNDTRYVGPVLKETPEELILRSPYGDVVISKKDIKDMDRYHGGRRVPWAEEKKTFYRGEAVLSDVMMDPTAFPLPANTFYLSGLSLGYGFTDRFMVRSSFGSDFMGDLNLHPLIQFYHRETGVSEVGAALGFHMFNHHPMQSVVAKYAQYVINDTLNKSINASGVDVSEVLAGGSQQFYWETYLVLSSRRSLASGRGKLGWHVGVKTNSLLLSRPALKTAYSWDMKKMVFPFRAWAAFEYDLSKRLKLMMNMWADNGHKFRDITQTFEDYIGDGSPFVMDSPDGDYRMVDFDFGFLYAFGETFRLGIHFQEPYLLLYWEFYEL
ncbi:MAG: hypothetical protein JSU77_01910 [Fidelibacterota bacterium]|nr:MAG: hypothetical protein JSU77_01910 [Candidatus Neomarinimicrobiota bacterium]